MSAFVPKPIFIKAIFINIVLQHSLKPCQSFHKYFFFFLFRLALSIKSHMFYMNFSIFSIYVNNFVEIFSGTVLNL